jgi:phosphosulfolactate phosphohydrolase-like enzyme
MRPSIIDVSSENHKLDTLAAAMIVDRCAPARLAGRHEVAVVIDVLRATSTAAVLLGRGARTLEVAAELADLALAPGALIISEHAEAAAHGPRIDNSPVQASALPLDEGRPLVLVTTNGTRALAAAAGAAERVFAASFLNLGATARYLVGSGAARVTLVPAGDFAAAAPHTEDERCADALAALLAGAPVDAAALAASCRDDARVLRRLAREPALAADLDLCLTVDRFPVVMAFHPGPGATGRLVACAT